VIEVLSPATAAYDRTAKAQRYATLGVPHYWIVDPEAPALECHRRREGTYTLVRRFGPDGSFDHPDFSGLALDLAGLWR
jgi:Uma2 family endonuclease